MVSAQLMIITFLVFINALIFALAIGLLLTFQILAMVRMMKNPKELVPWYNGTGVLLYVSGMMITAFALGYSDLF